MAGVQFHHVLSLLYLSKDEGLLSLAVAPPLPATKDDRPHTVTDLPPPPLPPPPPADVGRADQAAVQILTPRQTTFHTGTAS